MDIAELKSKRNVDDFSYLCEGDIEPTLNKKIHTLIIRTNEYIVYLDDELYVEWSHKNYNQESVEKFVEVINRMSNLEINSIRLLKKNQLLPFRRLLGESVARILGNKNYIDANKILDNAEEYLINRSEERARLWYLGSSFITTIIFLLIAWVLWALRDNLIKSTSQDFAQIITFSLFASVGALTSIISRVSSISMNALAGSHIHFAEGILRIIVGVIGSLFLLTSIKANVFLGFLNNKDNLPFLITIAIVAGFSEHLVPQLIKKIGNSIL